MTQPVLTVSSDRRTIGMRYEGRDLLDGKTGQPVNLKREIDAQRTDQGKQAFVNRVAAAMQGNIA